MDGSVKALIVTSDSLQYYIENIIASDQKTDIIKFKIKNTEKHKFHSLKISNEDPKKGDKVYCVSSPLGLENSLSEGIISAFRNDKKFGKVIQFSAPISPGSSGGAIINENGEAIGVATYTKQHGQNLNFGIHINSKLINSLRNDEFTINNPKFSRNENFVILNLKSEAEPGCVLNAIEFGQNITTVYFTYSNLEMMSYGELFGIWRELNKKDEGLTIKNLENNQSFYILSSTIGDRRANSTIVPFASSIRYKAYFPKITDSLNNISITQSSQLTSDRWTSLNLKKFKDSKTFNLDNFKSLYALSMLKDGEFIEAKNRFLDILINDPENIETLNALGVISFAIDNKMDALKYFSKGIEINPITAICYVNRSIVYGSQNNIKSAIEDMSKAINLNSTQIEYYILRSNLYKKIGDITNQYKDFRIASDLFDKENNQNSN